jgi:hypothetical protein
MMGLVAAVVLHFVAASAISGGSSYALDHSDQWGVWLEGARRTGIGLYLLSITLGLASIVETVRFQAVRIRELPAEAAFTELTLCRSGLPPRLSRVMLGLSRAGR